VVSQLDNHELQTFVDSLRARAESASY
jgi:hypothetical protein